MPVGHKKRGMAMKIALFDIECGQIVFLPNDFRIQGSEAHVRRDLLTGDVVLSHACDSWKSFFERADATDIPADFMLHREQSLPAGEPFEGWTDPNAAAQHGKLGQGAPMTLAAFRNTVEFDQLRRAVDEGGLSFDAAVQMISEILQSQAGERGDDVAR